MDQNNKPLFDVVLYPHRSLGAREVRYLLCAIAGLFALVGLFFTFFWSALDVLVSGKYARKPFCFIPRLDDVDEEVPLVKDDEKKDEEPLEA